MAKAEEYLIDKRWYRGSQFAAPGLSWCVVRPDGRIIFCHSKERAAEIVSDLQLLDKWGTTDPAQIERLKLSIQ